MLRPNVAKVGSNSLPMSSQHMDRLAVPEVRVVLCLSLSVPVLLERQKIICTTHTHVIYVTAVPVVDRLLYTHKLLDAVVAHVVDGIFGSVHVERSVGSLVYGLRGRWLL